MAREYRFPVEIAWDGGRRTTARVEGKQPLDIATPPEFRGTDPDLWSPEDVFVAAAGSCLAVTIAALADGQHLPLRNLDVRAEASSAADPTAASGSSRLNRPSSWRPMLSTRVRRGT